MGGHGFDSNKPKPITEFERQRDRFKDCVKKYGDANTANLTFDGYMAAQSAAADAQIDTSSVLAIWSIENSLKFDMTENSKGDIGPMQLNPRSGAAQLQIWNALPAGWNTDPSANLLAGARLLSRISEKPGGFGVPAADAPRVFHAGFGAYSDDHGVAQDYADSFDAHKAAYTKMVNCIRGQE